MSEYIYGTDDHQGHWLTGERIVRCRDCKRSEEWQGRTFCHKFSMSSSAGWPVEPDGFCAWGERRDD